MLKSNFSKIVAAFAVIAMLVPGLALATSGSGKADLNVSSRNFQASTTNEFGVTVFGDREGDDNDNDDDNDNHRRGLLNRTLEGRHDNGKHKGWFKDHAKDLKRMAYSGTVTAVSSTGFTFTANDGSSITVDTDGAKIVHLPTATLNSEISVGDKVHVVGTKIDNNIDAVVVYDFAAHLKAAVAEGTVTAVTEDSITVQTDEDSAITVNTSGDTKVVDANGDASTLAEVDTNDEVKLFGFWDTILNVFNAIKIRLQ